MVADTNIPDAQTQELAKQVKNGILTDDNGKRSSMRLMSIIALFASIWFGWMTINTTTENNIGLYITTAFLLAAFAPKALQKFIENAYPQKS